MQISELRQLLSTLETLLSQAQANKSGLSDLQRLSISLSNFDELTVAQFCKALDTAVGATSAASSTRSTVNDDAVASYTSQLSACGSDRAQFESILARMKADKDLRMGEISAIARAYVGGTSKYKKKADAFKDISLRFDAHTAGARRLAAASEIF